jgi:hypothetical protein
VLREQHAEYLRLQISIAASGSSAKNGVLDPQEPISRAIPHLYRSLVTARELQTISNQHIGTNYGYRGGDQGTPRGGAASLGAGGKGADGAASWQLDRHAQLYLALAADLTFYYGRQQLEVEMQEPEEDEDEDLLELQVMGEPRRRKKRFDEKQKSHRKKKLGGNLFIFLSPNSFHLFVVSYYFRIFMFDQVLSVARPGNDQRSNLHARLPNFTRG